jgi:hypothetical protein
LLNRKKEHTPTHPHSQQPTPTSAPTSTSIPTQLHTSIPAMGVYIFVLFVVGKLPIRNDMYVCRKLCRVWGFSAGFEMQPMRAGYPAARCKATHAHLHITHKGAGFTMIAHGHC